MRGFWDKAQKYPYLSDSESDGLAWVDIDGQLLNIPVRGDFPPWSPEVVAALDIFLDDYFAAIDEGARLRLERFPEPKGLDELHTIFMDHYQISPMDTDVIDVALAVACDRYIEGDPLWYYLIGPAGYLKTSICRAMNKLPHIYSIDLLTPKTLISGLMKFDKKTKQLEPVGGILYDLDDRVLICKDFTSILSMRTESRQELLAQLRGAYDGYLEVGHGTRRKIQRVKAIFGLLAAVTPIIDKHTRTLTTMGPRCLKIRIHDIERRDAAGRARRNLSDEHRIRDIIATGVEYYVKNTEWKLYDIPEELGGKLDALAEYVAYMRTHVYAKYSGGVIYNMDTAYVEAPTRIVKQMAKTLIILMNLRKHDEPNQEDYDTIIRVAFDTAIPEYQKIVEPYLFENIDKSYTNPQLSDLTGMSYQLTRNKCELMKHINIMKLSMTGEPDAKNKYHKAWILTENFKLILRDAGLGEGGCVSSHVPLCEQGLKVEKLALQPQVRRTKTIK